MKNKFQLGGDIFGILQNFEKHNHRFGVVK